MNTNRLSSLFGKPCKCCRVREKLNKLRDEAQAIEIVAGDCVSFWIPTVESFVKNDRQVHLMVSAESPNVDMKTDLRTFAIEQLHLLAAELTAAAERLEEGAK